MSDEKIKLKLLETAVMKRYQWQIPKKRFFLKHATVMEKFEHKRFKNEKKS